MTSEWIGPTFRFPEVEFVTSNGERLPVQIPVPKGGACGRMLSRQGWIALQVEQSLVALHDHDVLRPVRLPDVWTIAPAADPSLIIAMKHRETVSASGRYEMEAIQLIDRFGAVLASFGAPGHYLVGEVEGLGVLTTGGLFDWTGQRVSIPFGDDPIAVIVGRYIVAWSKTAGTIELVDASHDWRVVDSMECDSWVLPNSGLHDDRLPRALISTHSSGWIVVSAEHGIKVLDIENDYGHGYTFFDEHHVLISTGHGHQIVSIDDGTRRKHAGFPKRCFPEIDVTGRFNLDDLRRVMAPPREGPVTDEERIAALAAARHQVTEFALRHQADGEALLACCHDAVHLRTVIPKKRPPVGSNKFGGRPDLPPGYTWPQFDGNPMMFVGQLRTDDLKAAYPGMRADDQSLLLFFVGLEPDGGYPTEDEAVHVGVVPLDDLKRRAWPRALPEELHLDEAQVVISPMLSVQGSGGEACSPFNEDVKEDDEDDEFQRLLWLLSKQLTPDGPRHQMFGGILTLQWDSRTPDSALLLRFDSDPLLGGPELGDGGNLLIEGTRGTGTPETGLDRLTVQLDCF
jgi:hypothetical protein